MLDELKEDLDADADAALPSEELEARLEEEEADFDLFG